MPSCRTAGQKIANFFRDQKIKITESKYHWTYLAVLLLHFLNTFDAAMTVIWLETGHAYEANPITAFFLENGGPYMFLAAKLVGVTVFSAMLWTQINKHCLARIGVWGLLGLYMIIMLFHSTYLFFPNLNVGGIMTSIRTMLSI